MADTTRFSGQNVQTGFDVKTLMETVADATDDVKAKLAHMKQSKSSISIGDMFEMQMLMNHLTQLSEMTTNVVSASNAAIGSMARAIKG